MASYANRTWTGGVTWLPMGSMPPAEPEARFNELRQWFAAAALPDRPYRLNRGVVVVDPPKSYAWLRAAIARGPAQQAMRAIESRLEKLREMAVSGAWEWVDGSECPEAHWVGWAQSQRGNWIDVSWGSAEVCQEQLDRLTPLPYWIRRRVLAAGVDPRTSHVTQETAVSR